MMFLRDSLAEAFGQAGHNIEVVAHNSGIEIVLPHAASMDCEWSDSGLELSFITETYVDEETRRPGERNEEREIRLQDLAREQTDTYLLPELEAAGWQRDPRASVGEGEKDQQHDATNHVVWCCVVSSVGAAVKAVQATLGVDTPWSADV